MIILASTSAVVGSGYVGLPLAVEFGKKSRTIGYDLSEEKVAACRLHVAPTGEVSAEDLRVASGPDCTTDPRRLAEAGFVKAEKQELVEYFHQYLPPPPSGSLSKTSPHLINDPSRIMHSLDKSMWERRPRRDSSRQYRGEDAAPTQVPSDIAIPRILLMRESGFMFKLTKAEKQEMVTAGAGPSWRKLKERLKKQSNETVTNCHGLKMRAAGGPDYITDPRRLAETDFLAQSRPTNKRYAWKGHGRGKNPAHAENKCSRSPHLAGAMFEARNIRMARPTLARLIKFRLFPVMPT